MRDLGITRDLVFYPFKEKPLADILGIQALPFARNREPVRQLEYVENYVQYLINDYGGAEKSGTNLRVALYRQGLYRGSQRILFQKSYTISQLLPPLAFFLFGKGHIGKAV
jgi:hypothetical protein